jgi:hypothetical protein
MTWNPTASRSATTVLRGANPTSQARVMDREADPVRNPEHYARMVLHHAIEHGDVLGEDADGNIMVIFPLSPEELDRLATFDPDGDPD